MHFLHAVWKGPGGEDVFGDGPASDQVLLNDALDDVRGDRVIPGAFGIDNGDRAVLADPQAIGFGAVNAGTAVHQVQLRQSLLEIVPGSQAVFARRTVGIGLIGTKENMAADAGDVPVFGDLGQAPVHRTTRSSPSRRVTRSRSRYSNRGIAYLREMPVQSLKAPTLKRTDLREARSRRRFSMAD